MESGRGVPPLSPGGTAARRRCHPIRVQSVAKNLMLWTSINYWPAMRLAFEIILAIPALLFAAALWTGARHRRRLKEGRLFTEGNEGNEERKPAASPPPSLPSLPSVEH